MKKLFVGALLVAVTTVSGCAMVPSRSGPALVIDTKEPITATTVNSISKEGMACSTNYFHIISSGDSSIEAAKAAGDITNVASVDTKVFAVSVLYSKVCTVVKGN